MSDGVRDEIAEKSMYWRSEAVNARLRSTFPAEHRGSAALLLSALAPAADCGPDADEASCRLMLAALRLSNGDLTRLGMWVEAGRADARDLIAAAEYAGELGAMSGSGDDVQVARDADLDAYLAWVRG